MTHSRNAAVRATAVLAAVLGVAACAGDTETVTVLDDGSEFVVRTIEPGTGEPIAPDQIASVHYTGWLHDPTAADGRGEKFDSSLDRGTPFQFPLGAGRVIQGWDRGVEGMQIGETRELIIPASLGYGDRGAGGVIPPGATLVFEVELLGID